MREIRRFASLPSTMHVAAGLAREGAASGTVVIADEQTAGEGRLGRAWHSPAGLGLYFSVVLRVPVAAESLPAITLALGLGVRQAVHASSGLCLDIRWPNDLLAGDRKCAGILTQLHAGAVIAGVGLNVNHTSFPRELAATATSLRVETGRVFDRDLLLDAILCGIDEQIAAFSQAGAGEIFERFEHSSTWARGKHVVVDDAGIEGVTEGLDERGFLVVRTPSGERKTIVAGGVRAARAPAPSPAGEA